jgi:hypothetical protein
MSPAAYFALGEEWHRQERRKDERAALIAFVMGRAMGMEIEFQDLLPQTQQEPQNADEINQRVKDVLSGLR